MASISYDGTITYKYTYTTDGNIETVTDVPNDCTYTYKYDKNGDVIEYVKKKAGVTEIYSQSWESTDGLTSGNKISFDGKSYDTSITKDSQTSNVLTEKNILGNKQSFTYDSLGQKLSKKNNVYKLDYSYESIDTDNAKDNATGRIQQISYGKINNSFSNFSLKYEYDTLGRIVKVSDTKGNILAQYSYDAQGQLLVEKLPQQNKRYEYTYDTVGNIQEAKTYTLTGTTATATKKYTYGDASWNDLLTAYDGKEITYDGAGNPLAYNNGTAWKFTWEKGRELSSASADGKNITFTYDVDGIRDSKTINGVKHEYVTLDGLIYQEKWGNVIASTGTDSGIGAVNPLLYRGYYYDSELGMYYLRSRYYDPGVKRFINADSVDYLGENKTELSYNLFAYCENDAVNNIDSQGNLSFNVVSNICGVMFDVMIGGLAGLLEYAISVKKTTSSGAKNSFYSGAKSGLYSSLYNRIVGWVIGIKHANAKIKIVTNAIYGTLKGINDARSLKRNTSIRKRMTTGILSAANTYFSLALSDKIGSKVNIQLGASSFKIKASKIAKGYVCMTYSLMYSCIASPFVAIVNRFVK